MNVKFLNIVFMIIFHIFTIWGSYKNYKASKTSLQKVNTIYALVWLFVLLFCSGYYNIVIELLK